MGIIRKLGGLLVEMSGLILGFVMLMLFRNSLEDHRPRRLVAG